MEIKTDYQALVAEVKERNRFFLALKEIREIALSSRDENTPEDAMKLFDLILQKCNAAFQQTESIRKESLYCLRRLSGK